jgi:uncharacterized LabA/DUF88 family protein
VAATVGFYFYGGRMASIRTTEERRPAPKRIRVVIDGTNLKGALENHGFSTHINYRQLGIEIGKRLPAEHQVWRLDEVIYVTAAPIQSHNPERYARWRKFQTMIERQSRVELRLGRLEGPPGRVYEKGVDTLCAIALLAGAFKDQYDIGVIVAGDGDYADVAKEVQAPGKAIFNAFFEQEKSYELAKAATGFIALDQINIERLQLAPRPGASWRRRV